MNAGDLVHSDCRRNFTNGKEIYRFCRKRQEECQDEEIQIPMKTSMQVPHFDFAKHCVLCGDSVSGRSIERRKAYPVGTNDCLNIFKVVCEERKDRWATLSSVESILSVTFIPLMHSIIKLAV